MDRPVVLADPPDEERSPLWLLRLALAKMRTEQESRSLAIAITNLEQAILWLVAGEIV